MGICEPFSTRKFLLAVLQSIGCLYVKGKKLIQIQLHTRMYHLIWIILNKTIQQPFIKRVLNSETFDSYKSLYHFENPLFQLIEKHLRVYLVLII